MRSNMTTSIAIGKVTNNHDEEGQGRIEVQLTSLGENSPKRWCSVASASAGGDRGVFFMPENDDEVLVAFDQGNFDHAFVIGYPWNPVQMPPSPHPDQRIIRSREGHCIRFIDGTGEDGNHGALIVQDAHGNVITMTNGVMTINANGHLNINARSLNIMGRPVNPLGGSI